MAITNSLTPGSYNMAYGQNLFGFTGLVSEDKYVIRVKDGATVFADLRQGPNPSNDAVFDIQNIIQSYVSPSVYYIERLGQHDKDPGPANLNTPLENSANENFEYDVEYGYEENGVYTAISTLTNFNALGGTKKYYDNLWDAQTYRPKIAIDSDQCSSTITTRVGNILTDYANVKQQSQLSGGFPTTTIDASDDVLQYNKTATDHLTASFFNELERSSPLPDARSIDAFVIWQFSGSTPLGGTLIPNIIRNGGGPNTDLGDNVGPNADTLAITMGIGPQNLKLMRYYSDSIGSIQIYNLSSSTTHYYITTHASCNPACLTEFPGISDDHLHMPIRVDIVDENCLDYNRLEFSWQNSFGFRDYWTFEKKQQQSISVGRNDYLDSPVDFGGTAADAGAIYGNRGYTTYSQKIEERYLATTGYMDDATAFYLRNLYQSPDVRVRLTDKYSELGDVFFPVNLLTNRWNEKNYKKDKLFQYEATFKLANNIKSMRG